MIFSGGGERQLLLYFIILELFLGCINIAHGQDKEPPPPDLTGVLGELESELGVPKDKLQPLVQSIIDKAPVEDNVKLIEELGLKSDVVGVIMDKLTASGLADRSGDDSRPPPPDGEMGGDPMAAMEKELGISADNLKQISGAIAGGTPPEELSKLAESLGVSPDALETIKTQMSADRPPPSEGDMTDMMANLEKELGASPEDLQKLSAAMAEGKSPEEMNKLAESLGMSPEDAQKAIATLGGAGGDMMGGLGDMMGGLDLGSDMLGGSGMDMMANMEALSNVDPEALKEIMPAIMGGASPEEIKNMATELNIPEDAMAAIQAQASMASDMMNSMADHLGIPKEKMDELMEAAKGGKTEEEINALAKELGITDDVLQKVMSEGGLPAGGYDGMEGMSPEEMEKMTGMSAEQMAEMERVMEEEMMKIAAELKIPEESMMKVVTAMKDKKSSDDTDKIALDAGITKEQIEIIKGKLGMIMANVMLGSKDSMPGVMDAGSSEKKEEVKTAIVDKMNAGLEEKLKGELAANLTPEKKEKLMSMMSATDPKAMVKGIMKDIARKKKLPVKKKVGMNMKMEKDFTAELEDPTSTEFQTLASQVSTSVRNSLAKTMGDKVEAVIVLGFNRGSVIANTSVDVKSTVDEQESTAITDAMKSATESGDFDDLGVDPSSIKSVEGEIDEESMLEAVMGEGAEGMTPDEMMNAFTEDVLADGNPDMESYMNDLLESAISEDGADMMMDLFEDLVPANMTNNTNFMEMLENLPLLNLTDPTEATEEETEDDSASGDEDTADSGDDADAGDADASGSEADAGDDADAGDADASGSEADAGDDADAGDGDADASGSETDAGDDADAGDADATGSEADAGDEEESGDADASGSEADAGDDGESGDADASGSEADADSDSGDSDADSASDSNTEDSADAADDADSDSSSDSSADSGSTDDSEDSGSEDGDSGSEADSSSSGSDDSSDAIDSGSDDSSGGDSESSSSDSSGSDSSSASTATAPPIKTDPDGIQGKGLLFRLYIEGIKKESLISNYLEETKTDHKNLKACDKAIQQKLSVDAQESLIPKPIEFVNVKKLDAASVKADYLAKDVNDVLIVGSLKKQFSTTWFESKCSVSITRFEVLKVDIPKAERYVKAVLTIDAEDFVPDMANRSSPEFKKLQDFLTNDYLPVIQEKESKVKFVYLENVRKGSVVLDTTVEMDADADADAAENAQAAVTSTSSAGDKNFTATAEDQDFIVTDENVKESTSDEDDPFDEEVSNIETVKIPQSDGSEDIIIEENQYFVSVTIPCFSGFMIFILLIMCCTSGTACNRHQQSMA